MTYISENSVYINKKTPGKQVSNAAFCTQQHLFLTGVVNQHLGRSFSRVVEPRAAQEHVEFLPGLASRLFQVQISLDFWAAAGV